MRREVTLFALLSLILALVGLAACGPAEEEPTAGPGAEELAWLKENKPIIDAKRAELKEAQDLLAAGEFPEPEAQAAEAEGETEAGEQAEAGGGEGAEAAGAEGETKPLTEMTKEELEGRVAVLQNEITDLSDQIGEKVVAYLNAAQLTVDGERTPDQQFAINVKIAEDIQVAQEYIDKGGDYSRALDIYHMAQSLDPNNPDLLAAIEKAEADRYMTEERFAQVKKKMTEDQVRQLLGQVKHTNVREFEDKGVVGWFYRKEDGGAAGVYFKESKGEMLVYSTDFNAIEQEVREGEEGG